MANKKLPPKKVSKEEQLETALELDSLNEEESGLPSSFDVIHKSGKKFHVSRDYFQKNEHLLTRVEDDD